MTETQRAALASLLVDVRNHRFKGNRKAAYTHAGVNSATWKRVESGETLKETSLAAIVGSLFPHTGGDWQKLIGPKGEVLPLADAEPANAGADPQLLEAVMQQMEQVTQRLAALEKHLGVSGDRHLSVAPDEVKNAVAAHEEEGSIAGEQEESDTP